MSCPPIQRNTSDGHRAATAGVNEFFTKLFSPSKLATRLQQLSETTAQ